MLPGAAHIIAAVLLALFLAGCNRGGQPETASGNARPAAPNAASEQFLRLMNEGKALLDQGDATNALAAYEKAAAILPGNVDLRLSTAAARLAANQSERAVKEADEALKLEPNSAAAYFIKGSASLRLADFEGAVQAFENARKIEPGVAATLFQLGTARMGLKQWKEAIAAFQEGLAVDPNHLHAAAHYLLGQALLHDGRTAEGEREIAQHQATMDAGAAGQGNSAFERCKYTLARVPFHLDQPEQESVPIKFIDASAVFFGGRAEEFQGPAGIIPAAGKAPGHLFALQKGQGLRFLWNTNHTLVPGEDIWPVQPGAVYERVLVGDLLNDRANDIVVLGSPECRLLQIGTNGLATERAGAFGSFAAKDGLLMDLDFTGKLDVIAVGSDARLHIFRQFGPLNFREITAASGVPESLHNAQSVTMEDWNRDGQMDLVVGRKGEKPLLLEKQRGGKLQPVDVPSWSESPVFCIGDFDNDLRPDIASCAAGKIIVTFNSGMRSEIATGEERVTQIVAIDFDNDGWLDLWCAGDKLRAWRNRGAAGFIEQTAQLGLDQLSFGAVSEIHFADFDGDCDPDAVIALSGGGLRYLRNDGANANQQVKVQLQGNRSNASGLGCKVEIVSGGLRLLRTVHTLPVEIGVGKHQLLDSFLVHWFNWPQGFVEVPVECTEPVVSLEQTIQEGSCPYLYAWDGGQFRFVTDILGAAPVGLPIAEGRYIEADPQEIVWIGTEKSFPPRTDHYEVRITEELREVLYLDQARLLAVDHDPNTEVFSTSKLLPSGPYSPPDLVELQHEHPLLHAETGGRKDVTSRLRSVDGMRVSPPSLLSPQLRGLAEPHTIILDFGPLDVTKPLCLVLNGWLRFGGGMANIAASHDSHLPFPFPQLDAESASGEWEKIDVAAGAPAGKTKTIVIDLAGKLKPGTRRLRLSEAFEIHWDRIALMEKAGPALQVTALPPDSAQLRFRGFSRMKDLPADWPLTPDYAIASTNSCWTVIPGGWCTRYGDVSELIAERDEGLIIMNSGDELTLTFDSKSLPPKKPGAARDFFLFIEGWDKDSDFHVAAGTTVEPLPFHGMDGQCYARMKRPSFRSDALNAKYNTRWVDSRALKTHLSARR